MASDKITPTHILLPVSMLSFVMALFLGFQTTLLVSDRTSLHAAHQQQEKPLEEVAKIKTQVNALAIGTLKLSEQGNKDAQTIIAALKKNGIDVTDKPAQASGAPTATDMSAGTSANMSMPSPPSP